MATNGGIPLAPLNGSAIETNRTFTEGPQRRLRNHRIITWRTRNQGQEDQLQRDLQRATDDSSLRISNLLQDYLNMKEKPGHAVLSSLVWFSILKFYSQPSKQMVDISYLRFNKNQTLGHALEEFRRALNLENREFLRIW